MDYQPPRTSDIRSSDPRPPSRRVEIRYSYINRVSIALFILVIAALGSTGYFYWQYKTLSQNPAVSTQTDNSKLLEQVGKLINLPQDETPTIATVTDPSLLRNQDFFINAEKGDKVLIYTQANKAIIYRPSTNKLIDVGPITVGNLNAAIPTVAAPAVQATSTSKTKKSS